MLFKYQAQDHTATTREGTVDASSIDAAVATIEQRGYTVISIEPFKDSSNLLSLEINWFEKVSNKEIVIFSRQIATLFNAQVSALRVFRLLAEEHDNKMMQRTLNAVADELQSGSSISRALSSHPKVFSTFYVSMVKAGEDAGKLDKTFMYLADYMDRMYQVVSKAKNALIYPAFVIGTFFVVMGLMLTMVIPRISQILIDSGQELPIYTKIVIALSDFVSGNAGFLLVLIIGGGVGASYFFNTPVGRRTLDHWKITIPYIGDLYTKLYLTRLCDNLSTMLGSGISMVQAIEVTSEVIDNVIFQEILAETLEEVKGGKSFADTIAQYPEIPGVLAQMTKVGEETGNLPQILDTLSSFYRREVNNSVDTLIGLIEPMMIVALGLGVGVLLAAVLMPIYNITATI